MWFVDHFEQAPAENHRKIHLVCVDAFTRYVFCERVPNMEANTTSALLVRLFSIFGIPTTIHSDRGPAFPSDCHKGVCRLLKIDHRFSPVNFPRSNGLAERNVQSIKMLLADNNNLPWACYVHNSLPHSRSVANISPFEAAFGFKCRSLIDIHFDPSFETSFGLYLGKDWCWFAENETLYLVQPPHPVSGWALEAHARQRENSSSVVPTLFWSGQQKLC